MNLSNKIVSKAYLAYSALVFSIFFLLFYPLYLLLLLSRKKQYGLVLSHFMCRCILFFMGIRIIVENKHYLDKSTTYILCGNHFSFLDILSLPVLPIPFRFIGKASLSKLPVFGYFFKKYHISVEREKLRSNHIAFIKSIEALSVGESLAVFPEGGIMISEGFQMSQFKLGPFKMALETKTPIVPITIADNWAILPDDGKFNIRWKSKSRIIIHEPIDPSEFSMETIKDFQENVFNTIQSELNKRNRIESI